MWVYHLSWVTLLNDPEQKAYGGTMMEDLVKVLMRNLHFPKLLSFCPKMILVLSGEVLIKFRYRGCAISTVILQSHKQLEISLH